LRRPSWFASIPAADQQRRPGCLKRLHDLQLDLDPVQVIAGPGGRLL
jgi:hypothetical protein